MLNKDSIMTSVALATEVSQRRGVLVAKPNTVLAELVQASNSALQGANFVQAVGADGASDIQTFANTVDFVTTGDLENKTTHDQVLDAYIDDIAKATLKHVSFAKNIVKPVVIDFVEGVNNYLGSFKPPEASAKFEIEVCEVPELLEDESFVDTLRAYDGKAIVTPDLIPNLGTKTAEEVLAGMLIGDSDADEAVTAWYSRKGENFIKSIWSNFFESRESATGVELFVTYRDLEDMDVFQRADFALGMYLLSLKLYDNVDEGAKDISLNQYQKVIAETRDYAAAILADFLRKVEAFKKSNTLIISFSKDEKGARVFGTIYRPWLENGGSPELILGLIISGKRFTLQSLIDDARDTLVEKWKTFSMIHNATENNRFFDYFKDALRNKFKALLADTTEEEKAFIQQTTNFNETIETRFEVLLREIKTSDMDELYRLGIRLICRSRFYYTDAEVILSDILEAERVNPNIDVREAALIATMNYVVDYVADQLTVETY